VNLATIVAGPREGAARFSIAALLLMSILSGSNLKHMALIVLIMLTDREIDPGIVGLWMNAISHRE
jgi:hypothetical protein